MQFETNLFSSAATESKMLLGLKNRSRKKIIDRKKRNLKVRLVKKDRQEFYAKIGFFERLEVIVARPILGYLKSIFIVRFRDFKIPSKIIMVPYGAEKSTLWF